MGAALLALCGGARTAFAQSPASFRVVWSTSAGCGDARNFLSELKGRTSLLRDVVGGEHAITLIVETFPSTSGVRGQLTVRKPDGSVSAREVPGSDCREVESAMALIAALMVDPLAGDPQRVVVRRESVVPAAAPPPAPTPGWSLRLEQRLTVRSAVTPRWSWGQGLGLMITRERSALRPSAALSAQLTGATASTARGAAELDWAVAQLTVCPLGLRPSPGWDLRACGALQLGRLRGRGSQVAAAQSKTILWSSAALGVEARYRVLGPLWVGLESALTMPFTREEFYLNPRDPIHRVPALGGNVGFGLGLQFL